MAFPWLINGGDPNYLLSGMILQVLQLKECFSWSPSAFFGEVMMKRIQIWVLPLSSCWLEGSENKRI